MLRENPFGVWCFTPAGVLTCFARGNPNYFLNNKKLVCVLENKQLTGLTGNTSVKQSCKIWSSWGFFKVKPEHFPEKLVRVLICALISGCPVVSGIMFWEKLCQVIGVAKSGFR